MSVFDLSDSKLKLFFGKEIFLQFSKFMATLGGLFGVLMGLSVTSFIEFVFLFFKILGILIFNRGAK